MSYEHFLAKKTSPAIESGLARPDTDLHGPLFAFQRDIALWALKLGRSCVFADCGLGKTIMQLEWAHQIAESVGQVLILTPLADYFTGGFRSLGFAAAGGPINGPTIVGEKGPELLMGSYSTVIPNAQLSSSGGGDTFYIDAKGADTAAVSRLEQMIHALAGPGVVERRSLSAMFDTSRRRSTVGI